MSPPGHVFAFSLMKKMFPAAVPSPFTAERQDIYEIYSRIATEAAATASAAAATAKARNAGPTSSKEVWLGRAKSVATKATAVGGVAVGAAAKVARKLGTWVGEARANRQKPEGA